MDLLAELWQRVISRTELPNEWVTLAVAGAALLIVVITPVWAVTRHAVTIVHEAGHGLVATLSGRRLRGIRLHSDTSGVTVSVGKPRGLGMILTLIAGYPAPAAVGLGAAWALSLGYAVGVLWAVLALLILVLIQVRNWFGLWSVLVTGIIVFAVTWFLPSHQQSLFALLIAAFLLLGSIRTTFELQRARRRSAGTADSRTSDADQLARLTHLPGIIWVGLFLAAAVACAYWSVWLLNAASLR